MISFHSLTLFIPFIASRWKKRWKDEKLNFQERVKVKCQKYFHTSSLYLHYPASYRVENFVLSQLLRHFCIFSHSFLCLSLKRNRIFMKHVIFVRTSNYELFQRFFLIFIFLLWASGIYVMECSVFSVVYIYMIENWGWQHQRQRRKENEKKLRYDDLLTGGASS